MKNWKSNPLIKTLIIILLCILGAVTMWCGFGIMYFQDELFAETTSFLESSHSQWITRSYAGQIVSEYYDELLDETDHYYKNYTNIDYALYFHEGGGYRLERWTNDTHPYEKTYYFCKTENHFDLFDEEPYLTGNAGDEERQFGMIKIFVDDAFAKNDGYSSQYREWKMLVPYRKLYLPVGIASLAAFAAVLWMAFRSAGHSRSCEGIRLYWLDRIPLEILLAALLPVTFGVLTIGEELINSTVFGEETSRMIAAIILAMIESLFIFTVLMSIARRIKSRTLADTSFCGTFVYLIKNLPAGILVIAASAIYLGLRILIAEEPVLVILCDIIAVLIVLLMLANGRQLLNASARMAAGDLAYRLPESDLEHMHWFFRQHGEQLNSIAEGMNIAVEEQMKSERLKTELITNVSHDIKTPLTSIINYVDLLQKEHSEEEEKEYLEVLARNSGRLKKLTEDLVEASKASTGNISVSTEKTDVRELVEQSLAEFEEKLEDANLTPVVQIPEGLCVMADGRLLWRIFSNLLSNCTKYAMSGTRVYITAEQQGEGRAVIAVKNVSREPLNISADELMERFVRGDQARSSEGSGLGLNIARSLALLQNGDLKITVDGDYFKAEVDLPVC